MCLCLKLLSNHLNHALNSLYNRHEWRRPDWWRRQERWRCIDKTWETKTNLTMFHLSWNQRKINGSLELYTFVSCRLLDRKDQQHVLNSGISANWCTWIFQGRICEDHIIGLGCVASQQFNHGILGGAVLMSDQVTQVLRKYPELAPDSEGRSLQTELDMFHTAPAINNECPNLGRPTCSQANTQRMPCFHMSRHASDCQPSICCNCNGREKLQQLLPIEILTYVWLVDNGSYKQHRHFSRTWGCDWWYIDVHEIMVVMPFTFLQACNRFLYCRAVATGPAGPAAAGPMLGRVH